MESCECPRIVCSTEFQNKPSVRTARDVEVISLDFGRVRIGSKVSKKFTIRNSSENTQEYTIYRNPNSNPFYQTFDFHYNKTVARGKDLVCSITYRPLFNLERNVDSLKVYEGQNERCKLYLQGETTCPAVCISAKYLHFYCNPRKKTSKCTLEIKNVSEEDDAVYQFDIGEESQPFSITNSCGTIKRNSHTYITVTFVPTEYGLYSEKLACLVLHHNPRIIELFGLHTKDEGLNEDNIQLKRFQQDIKYRNDFCGFLYESLRVLDNPPPVSLTENSLDFGSVCPETHNTGKRKTLTTSLTNHMKRPIEVTWLKDYSNIFQVVPESVTIHPDDSILYQFSFTPRNKDQHFFTTMTAHIFWVDDRNTECCEEENVYIKVPLNTHIKLMGHSFQTGRHWISQLQIPETVLLPACTPNSTSYTTFMMKTTGSLPVSFKFVSPSPSNFVLEPMLGLITTYQIFAVQFNPGNENKKTFVEHWIIELNGNEQDRHCVTLRGCCEEPIVVIGQDNTVTFNTVYPGCEEREIVEIQNISTLYLHYSFTIQNDHLKIDYPNGKILPNESKFLQWTIRGSHTLPSVYQIICELHFVDREAICGKPTQVSVKIKAECEYSQLCSIPNHTDLGLVQTGSQHTCNFLLMNFGRSIVHYRLIISQFNHKQLKSDQLTIDPRLGTLRPKDKQVVAVHVTFDKSGIFNIKISYQICLRENSEILVEPYKKWVVFGLKFTSICPTIQIQNVTGHNFGPLFSKIALWQMLAVTIINDNLQTVAVGETRTVDMAMPNCEITEKQFYVTLLIRNICPFGTKVVLKRRKICDCALVEKSKGLTFRTAVYDCKHRDMFEAILSDQFVDGQSYQTLTFKVKYLEPGDINVSYVMYLSDMRTLIFNIMYKVLARDVKAPSKYRKCFSIIFGNVSVYERDPQLQALWLYNNSSNTATFSVNTDDIRKLETNYCFKIIDCINPSGSLPPFSSKPLLFRFRPIELKEYKFVVLLMLGDSCHELTLTGTGVKMVKASKMKFRNVSTRWPNFPSPDGIEFSQDLLKLNSILTWSEMNVMFYLTNTLEDDVEYTFEGYAVENVIEITTKHNTAILKPKECRCITLKLKSFDKPCKTVIQVPFKFLNITKYMAYKCTLMEYMNKEEELKGQFAITETGVSYPVNDIIVQPCPENFYKTLCMQIGIVSVIDVDLHMQISAQLQQSPHCLMQLSDSQIFNALYRFDGQVKQTVRDVTVESDLSRLESEHEVQSTENVLPTLKSEDMDILHSTIECLIEEVLDSELLYKTLWRNTKEEPPYYVQFRTSFMNDTDKQNLLKQQINFATLTIKDVLEKLVEQCCHEIFEFEQQEKNN